MKQKAKESDIVFPSDKIGVVEQFLPSSGTTHAEDHEIQASVTGRKYIDTQYYKAKVIPFKKGRANPKKGDIIIGHVTLVTNIHVKVTVGYIHKKPINPPISATMHVSDASTDFIDDLNEFYSAGDIIRAKVIDAKTYPIQLEVSDNNHGVLHTTCKICGEDVVKSKKFKLKCIDCNKEQQRNTASDYGNINFTPEY